MCIALLTTSHPTYPLILLSNRDEFLSRPTAPLSWHPPPHSQILSGRDLQRSSHGTWLGITRQGRIACLTNYREDVVSVEHPIAGVRSRGEMVNAWLESPVMPRDTRTIVRERIETSRSESTTTTGGGRKRLDGVILHDEHPDAIVDGAQHTSRDGYASDGAGEEDHITRPAGQMLTDGGETTRQFIERLYGESLSGVGGFSLVCGFVPRPCTRANYEGLAILSNRTAALGCAAHRVPWIARGEGTWGLSNSAYGHPWPKVVKGRRALDDAVRESLKAGDGQKALVDRLMGVLSVGCMPEREAGEGMDEYMPRAEESVLVRVLEDDDGKMVYGTREQSVILVGGDGKVVFVERTLYEVVDGMVTAVGLGSRDRWFEFMIEDMDGDDVKC